jgi:nicotinamidase-related amidase
MASTTLRELTGQPSEPSCIKDSALIMLDCQNTFRGGVMKLEGVREARRLLEENRVSKRLVVHIVHDAGPGTPYDVSAPIGRILPTRYFKEETSQLSQKNFPSAFTGTDIHGKLRKLECKELILAGFMTHICVNSTARSAFELGYRVTVIGGATATIALPAAKTGAVVDAKTLKESLVVYVKLATCLVL